MSIPEHISTILPRVLLAVGAPYHPQEAGVGMTDVVLGKWRCREGVLNEGWVVERMDFTNPLLQLYGLDQRAAIAYTDALNHADAAVSDVAQHIRQNATFYSFRPGESPHIERPLAAEHNDGGVV